jgi:hypothetical protein
MYDAVRDYTDLLTRKAIAFQPAGIEPPELCAAMFPHQQIVTDFLLRTGCGAAFLDTGLGKSLIALDWGRCVAAHTGKPVLMLAPLAVGPQHQREAQKFGIDAVYMREPSGNALPPVVITNYERLHLWDAVDFAGVILDECFAPDTPIDCVDSTGKVYQKHIEDVCAGDHILNAAGVDVVSDVHRREVPYAIRVRYGGKSVIASPNHPFLTSAGWKGAMDIIPGDEIVATAAAMRILRSNVHGEACSSGKDALLRTILLSEMADAPAGARCEGAFSRGRRATRREEKRMAAQRQAGSRSRNRAHSRTQSNVKSRNARKSFTPIEREEARTFRAWGQRTWFDATAVGFDGCAARQLDGGICFVTGASDSRLSNALQTRLSQYREKNSYRGGWSLAPFARRSRPEEGSEAEFLRVDGIEVLELGHPDLDQYRDADGKLYFYDIGGTRHPSFSIHGGLVHNSSILKSFQGKTKNALISTFRDAPFRLACTATPAPNDHMELGNHAEFLGVMRSAEMLSRWFVNDTSTASQKWRLKGHAAGHFWDWVASWARCVSKPSDIGLSDDGFALPELLTTNHEVTADRSIGTGEELDGQSRLFRIPEMSATSIHKEKALTLDDRADAIASVVSAETGEPWIIWVHTDAEADAMRSRLRDAIEVRGSMKAEVKEDRLVAFSEGRERILITKPSIAGFGLNWQHCARMAFVGMSFSYESYYQAVRRCWRFGQARPVHVHVAMADTEKAIFDTVARKSKDHSTMKTAMTAAMRRAMRSDSRKPYDASAGMTLPEWLH